MKFDYFFCFFGVRIASEGREGKVGWLFVILFLLC